MAGDGEVMVTDVAVAVVVVVVVVVVIAPSRFVRWRECFKDAALMFRMKRFLARFVSREMWCVPCNV